MTYNVSQKYLECLCLEAVEMRKEKYVDGFIMPIKVNAL